MKKHCRRWESHQETQRRLKKACTIYFSWKGDTGMFGDPPIDEDWREHPVCHSYASLTYCTKAGNGKWYWKRKSSSHRGVSKRLRAVRRKAKRATDERFHDHDRDIVFYKWITS